MLPEFLSEIRRRRVVRAVLMYAVAGWAVIQVAATVFPVLEFPEWSTKAVVIAVILGFPVAAALAWAFDLTAQGVARATPAAEARGVPRRVRVAAVLLLGAAAALLAWRTAFSTHDRNLDRSLIAVLPFRVSGTDASLEPMGEGMVDLLSIKLQADDGTRVADPRAVIAAWRRAGGDDANLLEADLLAIARRLGAARMLTGEVVTAGRNVVLSATVVPLGGGRRVSAHNEGPADSLAWLVERLTGQLLSREAGEREDRLAQLTSTSLPALKHYLRGQSEYRRGHYAAARKAFSEALELDSAFSLAGMGVEMVAVWAGGTPTVAQRHRARRIAWEGRERLGSIDRAMLHALLGGNFPQLPTEAEKCRAWKAALKLAPDRSDIMHWIADCAYHLGPAFGVGDHLRQARALFERAFAADSSFLPNVEHLLEIAAAEGDTAAMRSLLEAYVRIDSTADGRMPYDWMHAYLRADTAIMARLRGQFARHPGALLVSKFHRENNTGVEWSQAVVNARPRAEETTSPVRALELRFYLALLGGRPDEARGIAARVDAVEGAGRGLRWILLGGSYSDMDSLLVAEAARALAKALPGAVPARAEARAEYYDDACTIAQYRLWQGDTTDVQRIIGVLADATIQRDTLPVRVSWAHTCAVLLRSLHAYANSPSAPELRQHALRLDSLAAEWPDVTGSTLNYAVRHSAARLLEASGDPAAALHAVERRAYMFDFEPFQETRHRESGRFAERLGDHERARREYQRYLEFRRDEDEVGRAASQPVREALARLTADRP